MHPVTVVVAEDHERSRAHLVRALEQDPRVRVIAAVADGASAISRTRAFVPDVLVTGLVMAGADGLAVAAAVRSSHPGVGVVLTSASPADELALGARASCVGAIVGRERPRSELLEAVVRLGRGALPLAA